MANAIYSCFAIALSLALGYGTHFLLGGLPPSLYGMLIFTLLLHKQVVNAKRLETAISWGLKNMGVCFVPAGVGMVNHYQLVKAHGLTLVAIIFVSTFALLTLVGVLFQQYENKQSNV